MDKLERDQAASRGYGKFKKLIHTSILLHNNWEMDNKGWSVEFKDGRRAALATNHSGACPWTRQEVEENLVGTEASVASICKALEL